MQQTVHLQSFTIKANSAVQAQTWGDTSKDNLKKNLTYNPNTRKNCTYVTLSIGKQYQIYNTIADSPNYYSYAGLKLKSTNAIFSDTVSGFWSPDSVNTGSMPIATP